MWRARVGTGRRRLVFAGEEKWFFLPILSLFIFLMFLYYNLFGLNISWA